MHLIIDIGNSRVKYFFNKNTYFSIEELENAVFSELLGQNSLISSNPEQINEMDLNAMRGISVIIVSTVPAQNQKQADLLRTSLLAPLVRELKVFDIDSQVFPGMSTLTNLYSGIGADRVAKLTAALNLYSGLNIILLDFGTATTLTAASSKYEYKCGFISLGFKSTLKSLSKQADQLPNLSTDFDFLFNTMQSQRIEAMVKQSDTDSTKENILYGTYNAHIALVEKWVDLAKEIMPGAFVLGTGGCSKYFEDYCDNVIDDASLYEGLVNWQGV